MLCSPDENKSRMIAPPARWEALAINTGDFVLFCVEIVMPNLIDSGILHRITRFVLYVHS
jgi:hypothetical protein